MANMEAMPISTNDLLAHMETRMQLHGNEVAWVRSISGPAGNPVLAVGLGTVTMFGRIDVVRERLAALVGVVDAAIAQPERWPQIGLRHVGEGHWTRDAPNPFVAPGNGPAGPELVRPIGEVLQP